MSKCITCGSELHPERAEKYDYCTDPECQERNARGLTILAVGVNKAADHYQILDEPTKKKMASGRYAEELASGRYQDRQRAAFGKSGKPRREGDRTPAGGARAGRRAPPSRNLWSESQRDLGLIYNARGMRPDEIAAKLGLSTHTVVQMLLSAKNRVKP
ncbi:MAG TPA: hypothetical protein VFA45_03130 [Actinomycetes bacterium]|nr:hypothetical protein [Actinomycetes bacterium]